MTWGWLFSATLLSIPVARAVEQTDPIRRGDGADSPVASNIRDPLGTNTSTSIILPTLTVMADLDKSREEIAPSLGAVTYTIGRNQIDSIPGGGNAPFSQVMLRAPGVVADSYGEYHVRGEHGNLTYRVNGVQLPHGLNGFGQELDTRLINSVTLIDGSLPAEFGFHTAGIVDVTTKSGRQLNGGEISLYGGGYNTFQHSFEIGGSSQRFEYFITYSYKRSALGIENPTSSRWPWHDDTQQQKAFSYFTWNLDETSRISLLVNASYADFQIPNHPDLVPQFQLEGHPFADSSQVDENQNERNYYAVLSYQKAAGDLSYQASAFTRFGQIHFEPDPVGDLIFQGLASRVVNSFLANGLQFDASYDWSVNHTWRAGFLCDYTIQKLETSSLVFPVNTNGWQSSQTPIGIDADNHLHGVTAGLYLQDEWRLLEDLTLNFGIRYDRFDASFDHEDQVSPRANIVWRLHSKTSMHLGYARYFTPPSVQYISPAMIQPFEGTTGAADNLQADPTRVERSHYFDIGISQQITSDWQVTLDGFYKDASNLIDLGQFGSAVILSPFSYRLGHVYGSEFSTTYKRGSFSLFANTSFVATSARDINSAQFEFSREELAYIETHDLQLDHEGRYTASAGATYQLLKGTRVYVDALYGYGLRKGFANQEKEPAYHTVNLGVEQIFRVQWGPIHQLKLRLDCINLADEDYQLRDGSGIGINAGQFGQRRTVLGGLSLAW